MNLDGKFALVTGGSEGIGLATTLALVEAGARVLIVGRDKDKLSAAARRSSSIATFTCDLISETERNGLIEHVKQHGTPLDILINNAGSMQLYSLLDEQARDRTERELALNLHAPIDLTMAFLPDLLKRPQAAVVNVTTGLIYAPFGIAPSYSASKNGLHAFTLSLRWQTRSSALKVIELMPPTVDTQLVTRFEGKKISADTVAHELLNALRGGREEVRVGQSKVLYAMSRIAPKFIFKALNTVADKALPS